MINGVACSIWSIYWRRKNMINIVVICKSTYLVSKSYKTFWLISTITRNYIQQRNKKEHNNICYFRSFFTYHCLCFDSSLFWWATDETLGSELNSRCIFLNKLSECKQMLECKQPYRTRNVWHRISTKKLIDYFFIGTQH